MNDVMQKVAAHIVNTRETVEVYAAEQRVALDEGGRPAVAGLRERALETFQSATPNPKPTEDANRVYNTGVACEELAKIGRLSCGELGIRLFLSKLAGFLQPDWRFAATLWRSTCRRFWNKSDVNISRLFLLV